MERIDGRKENELRPVKITKDFTCHAEGSVLIEMGNTKVLCNATVEESVPPFLRGSGEGWVTAEYAMLPRATATRNKRDISRLKMNQRSVEIQRLIGRSLRAAVDKKMLGERSITIDCDVLQADGGTRTASITGAFVALAEACRKLVQTGVIGTMPLKNFISAVSVGIVDGVAMLDLCYHEDKDAEVDMNIVMTGNGDFVEVQGTGENGTFSQEQLEELLALGKKGTQELVAQQKAILGDLEKVSAMKKPDTILFATKNKGKIKEINAILADMDIRVLSMEEAGISIDVVEDGKSFEENATKKAVEIMRTSGMITLADDSGLEIDYLFGAPGIYSARFLGEDTPYPVKNQKILNLMEGVTVEKRSARFVSCIAAAFPDGKVLLAKDTIEGVIDTTIKGENGFGYDPIFFVPEKGMTTAEMPSEIKNEISHRGKALRKMKELLSKEW